MPEIRWDLAQTPNFVGNALQARAQGQSDRMEQGKRNALQLYAQDPTAGIKALSAYDPMAAGQLEDRQIASQGREARTKAAGQYSSGDVTGAQQTAAAAGDFDLLKQFHDMTEDQLEESKRINDIGVSVSLGLKKVPPEARAAQLQTMVPQLKAQGFTDAQIKTIALDDAGIDAGVGMALKAGEIIAQTQKDREFQAGRDDETWKRGFEGKKFDHTVQNDNAQLGQGQQRINIARQSEARQAASADRIAQGRQIPGNVKMGYAANSSNVTQIDDALSELNKRPKSVGLSMALGDAWNQRTDKDGITARAAIANIGSLIIHDRSGAAVTISESPRLMPFIPTVTDTADAARKKLTALKRQIQNQNAEIETAYDPSNGYTPLGAPGGAAEPAAQPAPTVLRFDARGNRIK